jgi:hypothetical protein
MRKPSAVVGVNEADGPMAYDAEIPKRYPVNARSENIVVVKAMD